MDFDTYCAALEACTAEKIIQREEERSRVEAGTCVDTLLKVLCHEVNGLCLALRLTHRYGSMPFTLQWAQSDERPKVDWGEEYSLGYFEPEDLAKASNRPQDCKTNACISPERASTGEVNMSNKPVVRAKMRCNSVTKTGSERHPSVNVQLGAVFSNDPESENRSFAQATPSASVSINIDPGRAAASSFELGGEYYVDFTPCGIPERHYIGDGISAMADVVVLTDREGTKFLPATYDGRLNLLVAELDGVTYSGSPYGSDMLKSYGYTHWMYPKE